MEMIQRNLKSEINQLNDLLTETRLSQQAAHPQTLDHQTSPSTGTRRN